MPWRRCAQNAEAILHENPLPFPGMNGVRCPPEVDATSDGARTEETEPDGAREPELEAEAIGSRRELPGGAKR